MESPEALVRNATTAIRAEDQEEIQRTFVALAGLPLDEIYADVCVSIEETLRGRNADALLTGAKISLPPEPRRLIMSVWKRDFEDLANYAGGDLAKLLAALLVLNASLQEASERIE